MVVIPPWAPPKRGWIDCCGIGKRKGEIKRVRDEPYCAFFDGCSEGGCDGDGDEDGSEGRDARVPNSPTGQSRMEEETRLDRNIWSGQVQSSRGPV